jgi:uncharacterized protein YpmS
MRAILVIFLLLLSLASAPAAQNEKSPQPKKAEPAQDTEKEQPDKNQAQNEDQQQGLNEQKQEPTSVDIAAGDLHMPGGAVLHVERLRATSISRISGAACKCKESTIQIRSGQLSTTDADLTKLLNHRFEKKGEKKHIEIVAEGDKIKLKGTKASILPIDFEAKPVAIGHGKIELQASKIKAGPIPVEGLMHVFGMNMDDVMHPKNRAVSISKDNIIIDLEYVSKNPKLVGTVRTVAIKGHRIVLTFGTGLQKAKTANPAPASKKNASKKPA